MNQRPRGLPNVGNGLGGLPRRRAPSWSVRPDPRIATPSAFPHHDKCVLLLPMNGINNGTTFTDYSPSKKQIARYGNTKTSTAQSKYYGSSGYFDGNLDYLSIANDTTLVFGTGAFTVELWVYATPAAQTKSYPRLVAGGVYNSPGAWNIVLTKSNAGLTFEHYTTPVIYSLGTLSADTWTHLAVTRDESKVIRGFRNGTLTFSATDDKDLNGTNPLLVGRERDGSDFLGYLQDLRITKGLALYTNNFIPPGKMFGTISNRDTDLVRDSTGAPASRRIFAVPRGYAGFLTGYETTSDSNGRFSIANVLMTEHNVIVESAEDRFNDYIIPRVMPT